MLDGLQMRKSLYRLRPTNWLMQIFNILFHHKLYLTLNSY